MGEWENQKGGLIDSRERSREYSCGEGHEKALRGEEEGTNPRTNIGLVKKP